MKNLKSIVLIVIGMLLVTCKSESQKLAAEFNTNYDRLSSMVHYIDNKMGSIKNDSLNVLAFTLKPQYSRHNNIIYVPYLASKMVDLHIKEIQCFTTYGQICGSFDTVQFQLLNDNNPIDEVIYYVFDRCDKFRDFESKTIYQKKLKKNWGLLIDRS